jgi:glycosyltransferase involved in cell wall biosynthesis
MISVIIPAHEEPYLDRTIESLSKGAKGDVDIIPVMDDGSLGMRGAINVGLKKAKGKYIMKCDAHCLFADGWDEVILKDFKENWLVIPRRYSLNAEKWAVSERKTLPKDYHYLSFPVENKMYGKSLYPQEWTQRTKERLNNPKYDIDDTMTFQGSCYFANRKYFMDHVGYLNDKDYTSFAGEPLEVGLNYWLGGGEVKVNKNTWYAHLFKNKNYYKSVGKRVDTKIKRNDKTKSGHIWGCKHWMNNEEPNMVHKFSWLMEKFWPVPGWPEGGWKL